jgi:lysyl-tRNA synthetase class 2
MSIEIKQNIQLLKEERLAKAQQLITAGQDPYSIGSRRTATIAEFIQKFSLLEESSEEQVLAGRIIAKRGHGALIFVDLHDGTERTQALLREDEMDTSAHTLFSETIDTGDFVELTGVAMTTQRGAQSLLVTSWRILTKSLLPLPKEHFGIKDEDERYRKRYLDMILNEEIAQLVAIRSKFWNTIRSFLLTKDFTEVETPILENTTGGAEATPFITHHDALDIDVYLRISPELWHKRLIVGGIPKVFEIGRIFRNEGMSAEHLQDYTQLEFYEAYSDYTKGMDMIKDLYRHIAHNVFGTGVFTIKGHEIDFDKEWETYNLIDIIKERFSIDPLSTTLSEVHSTLSEHSIAFDPQSTGIGRGIDLLWKSVRKEYVGPGFLVGVPKYLEPLAKSSPENPDVVERFQVILAGSEMGKGFSELNDPTDQRERFAAQQALRDAGDDEAQMADETFIEALEHGMPPTFGFGVSERLIAFLMDKSIRETSLFPLMRPKGAVASENNHN